MALWTWGIDYKGQPLLDAWWTPGWTAQNDSYIQVPQNNFLAGGFPPNLTYVTVTSSYFDLSSDPLPGYLTFWPSTPLTYTSSGMSTYFPQRYAGINESLLGINQMGDGKIYLQYGKLTALLLATDNSGFSPTTFTYHVEEHFQEGRQYDITVPSASAPFADLTTLIIPGTVRPLTDTTCTNRKDLLKLPVVSTQYLNATVASHSLIMTNNPTANPVYFSFVPGAGEPASNSWIQGSWATTSEPYVAQILIGPAGTPLTVGTYRVWVKAMSGAQIPVIPVGYVEVF